MLNLIGADWQPAYVDFFKGGETRTPKYRSDVNEMGEVPVLVHGAKKLTQSGVILTYLSDLTGKFKPQGEDEKLEALRWIIFDNQKVNGFLGPYRFLKNFARPQGYPAVPGFLKSRIDNHLANPGTHKNIAAWLDRIKPMPNWKHPYELMPGHPLPA